MKTKDVFQVRNISYHLTTLNKIATVKVHLLLKRLSVYEKDIAQKNILKFVVALFSKSQKCRKYKYFVQENLYNMLNYLFSLKIIKKNQLLEHNRLCYF